MLKKLVSLMSIIAMLTTAVPTASAVMLDNPVALDKTVVVANADIGNKGSLSAAATLSLPSTTGDYVLTYPLTIVNPMSSFTLTMNTGGAKVSGFLTLDSYDEETGTYAVNWVERNATTLGTIEVGKTYTVRYEFENVGLGGEGKKPMLKSLTLTDEDGNVAASGSSLRLRNFSDTSNGASKIGFSQAVIAITALEGEDAEAPEIVLGDFVSFTSTGADEVVVSVDGTELNATGNDVIDIASSGTGDEPIVFDAVVKQAGNDVSENYKVVYSLKEDIKGISIEDNKLKVSSVAAVGTLNPVVVVSLTNAEGTTVYDSFAEIEMNLNKAEPTPIEYLQGLLDTLNLDYDLNGYEIICQDDIYNVFYGVKGFSKGDKKADVEWKCYEQQDGEWVESDLINFETGEYTKDTDYDGTFKITATAVYKETSDKLYKEFSCIAQDVYAEIPVSSTVSSEVSGGKLITRATFNSLSEDGTEEIFIVTYNKDGYIENIKKYDSNDLIKDGRNKKYLIQELRVSSVDDNVYKQKAFILDKNFMPIAKSSSTETSVEKITKNYAWLIDTYIGDSGVYKAKILTQDNTISEFEFADIVEFWGSNADDEKENLSFKDDFDAAKEKISNALEYDAKNDKAPAGLVKFKTDDDGKINMLYMSYVTYDPTEINNGRPTIYKYSMYGSTGWDNVIGRKFYLCDEMLEFTIATDYTADTEKEYSVKTVKGSEYIHYDGVDKEFYLACFDGITANIAINIESIVAGFTYNTADNNPIMMVSEINEVDGGYEIVGYRNGEEVKYTTAYNVCVSEATEISGGYINNNYSYRHYAVTPIWTNSNKKPTYTDYDGNEKPVISEENQAKYIDFTDAVSVGDIIGVASDSDGNAKTIIKMINMPEYVQNGSTIWGTFRQYSNTRDSIAFGRIAEYLSKNTVGANYSGAVIQLNTDEVYQIKDIDTVTMYDTASGEVSNCDINDLEEGDKVFIRTFKGDLKEVFAIRESDIISTAEILSTETSVEKITKNYAWLIDTYIGDSGVYKAKILTQDNTISEFEFADTVEFWGSNTNDEKENLSFKDDFDAAKEKISKALEYDANSYGPPTGLVKFKTDDDGKINMLYMSYVIYDPTEINNDRPTIYRYNMDGSTGSDNVIVKKFYLCDEMLEFTIATDYTADTEKEYSVKTVKGSEYIHYDGVYKKFYLACFDGITANIAINIESIVAEFTYNTEDNNPIMMVNKINKVDGGYEIVGYRNGEEVKYTTAYNVCVSEATGISGGYTGFGGDSNRNYGVTPIWTNSNKKPTYTDYDGNEKPVISEENQAKYIDFTDAVSVGDIISVASDSDGNAKTIIKMINMPEYVQNGSTIWGTFKQYSTTRDGIAFGRIAEYLSKNTVGAKYNGAVIQLGTGEVYQIKDIDTITMYDAVSGEVSNCDIDNLDEGDKVFIRIFKGELKEVFAIR